jgi:hypothetical protein
MTQREARVERTTPSDRTRLADARDAWEVWQHSRRALHNVLPWTSDWLRLRMIEQDRRAAYFAILDATDDLSVGPDPLAGGGNPGIAESGTGAEAPPKTRDGATRG